MLVRNSLVYMWLYLLFAYFQRLGGLPHWILNSFAQLCYHLCLLCTQTDCKTDMPTELHSPLAQFVPLHSTLPHVEPWAKLFGVSG